MIYLDSAATTFQKPPTVARAMTEALSTMSSPGRGGHPLAMRAADTAFRCRSELAALFNMKEPERGSIHYKRNARAEYCHQEPRSPRRAGGGLRL